MSAPTGEATTVTPSPLDMPGAVKTTPPAPVTPEPARQFVETNQPAPQAPAPTPATSEALTDDDRNELERLRAIHADEKKWEKRAKENFEARQKLDTIASQFGAEGSKEFDPQAEVQRLRDEIQAERTQGVRERIARETGVPPSQIHGTDEASMTASATEALNWAKGLTKQNGVPLAAPAATVTSTDVPQGPKQIQSRDDLKTMTPAQIRAAHQSGQLNHLLGKA